MDKNVYQLQKLKNFREAKITFENNYKCYCSKITSCIKQRLEWLDLQLLKDIIEILATQGWEKIIDEIQDETTADSSSTSTEPWLSVTRTASYKIYNSITKCRH